MADEQPALLADEEELRRLRGVRAALAPPPEPPRIAPGDYAPAEAAIRPLTGERAEPSLRGAMETEFARRPHPPTAEEYAAVSPHGWRKGLGALFTGMAAFGNPEAGERAYQHVFVEPRQRLNEQYQGALTDWNQRFGEQMAVAREQREQENVRSEIGLRRAQAGQFDMVPVQIPGQDEPVYVQQKDKARLEQTILKPQAKKPAHVLYDQGIATGIVDEDGVTHDVNDANLPTNLKPLVDAAEAAHRRHVAEQKALAAAARAPAEEKAGAKWVTWEENGRMIAGPMSMAKDRGMKEFAELPAQEVRDLTNARHAVQLLTKRGDAKRPESQGVLQLIESLDRDGKLGIAASRWNSLMTTGVGTSPDDDPRIVTLINKNMLGDTATMLAHFGASGGRSPQMLQHFLDLANARKMDGVTLRAGVLAMADYMSDRAMLPGEAAQAGSTPRAWNPQTGKYE